MLTFTKSKRVHYFAKIYTNFYAIGLMGHGPIILKLTDSPVSCGCGVFSTLC